MIVPSMETKNNRAVVEDSWQGAILTPGVATTTTTTPSRAYTRMIHSNNGLTVQTGDVFDVQLTYLTQILPGSFAYQVYLLRQVYSDGGLSDVFFSRQYQLAYSVGSSVTTFNFPEMQLCGLVEIEIVAFITSSGSSDINALWNARESSDTMSIWYRAEEECTTVVTTVLSNQPSSSPMSSHPTTGSPSLVPSAVPTNGPVVSPTGAPAIGPTGVPSSSSPSNYPTEHPTSQPTSIPSIKPTGQPTFTTTTSTQTSTTTTFSTVTTTTTFSTRQPTSSPIGSCHGVSDALLCANFNKSECSHFESLPDNCPGLCNKCAPTGAPSSSNPTYPPSPMPTNQPSASPIKLCHGASDPDICSVFNIDDCVTQNIMTQCPALCGACSSTVAPSIAPSASIPSISPTMLPTGSSPTASPTSTCFGALDPDICQAFHAESCGNTSLSVQCPVLCRSCTTLSPDNEICGFFTAVQCHQYADLPTTCPALCNACAPTPSPSKYPSNFPSVPPSQQPSTTPTIPPRFYLKLHRITYLMTLLWTRVREIVILYLLLHIPSCLF